MSPSVKEFEERGWFLSQQGIDLITNKHPEVTTVDDYVAYAKNMDLRLLTTKGIYKGEEIRVIPSPLVLQVVKVRNIPVPPDHPDHQRLLSVILTDGSRKMFKGVEMKGRVECLDIKTPPGTKYLVKKPIEIKNRILVLGPDMLEDIGGHVIKSSPPKTMKDKTTDTKEEAEERKKPKRRNKKKVVSDIPEKRVSDEDKVQKKMRPPRRRRNQKNTPQTTTDSKEEVEEVEEVDSKEVDSKEAEVAVTKDAEVAVTKEVDSKEAEVAVTKDVPSEKNDPIIKKKRFNRKKKGLKEKKVDDGSDNTVKKNRPIRIKKITEEEKDTTTDKVEIDQTAVHKITADEEVISLDNNNYYVKKSTHINPYTDYILSSPLPHNYYSSGYMEPYYPSLQYPYNTTTTTTTTAVDYNLIMMDPHGMPVYNYPELPYIQPIYYMHEPYPMLCPPIYHPPTYYPYDQQDKKGKKRQ